MKKREKQKYVIFDSGRFRPRQALRSVVSLPLFMFISLSLLFSGSVCAKGTELDIKKMPLPDAVSLLWTDVFNEPFMLAPELADDPRLMTLKLTRELDEKAFITRYLSNLNIRVSRRNNVDYIYSYIPDVPQEKLVSFTYAPRYRTVEYLYAALSQVFMSPPQVTAGQQTPGGGTIYTPVQLNPRYLSPTGDTLVYRGTPAEISHLKALLGDLDTRAEQAEITAYVFEVQTQEKNGSGMALAANLLSGRFNVGINTSSGYSNFIQFSGGSVDALYELFSQDSRFNVVSSPHLRVASGHNATFSVGSDVPVLSSVTYNDKTPVQSVEYRSSGVIFTVKPLITQHLIDLDVTQQLSNFAKTETGVNNSPTLIKREIQTNVNMKSGDIIVLGGLAETKNSEANTGFSFLPDAFRSKSDENSKTDIIVVLQVKKVAQAPENTGLKMQPLPSK